MQLFPYQEAGAAFLAARRFAYLADQMRLGKSAQSIRACDVVASRYVRVVCPAVARINWAREFKQFGQMDRRVVPILSKAEAPFAASADVSIVSYEMADLLPPLDGGVLLVDEAHYLKSLDAERAKAVIGKHGLVHSADRTWFLSATPTPNNPSELWTILRVAGVTDLSFDEFVARFCKGRNTPFGFRITAAKNADELRALLSGFLLRRTKAQVRPELPPILFSSLVVAPGPVDIETHFYPQWHHGGDALVMAQVKAEGEKVAQAQSLGALEQIMDQTPIYRRYVGLQKVAPVVELVKAQLTADPAMKIVLFAWHQAVIEGLRQGLAEFGAVTLYGGTAPAAKQKNIDRFNTNPHCRVFIGQIIAAGLAIPLTGAHQGLIVEPDWVPGNNVQASYRMDGPNQTEQITVQFVSIASPLDEAMNKSLLQKARMEAAIFD